MGEKGEKIKICKFPVIKSNHRDVKYSIRNIVNNIAITMYDVRWLLDLSGYSLCKL